ncbi:hypothetical protein GC209_03150 [bacterium]|nr:hypothetical protein [bacterium]
MTPKLTVYFIVEPPDYQVMACYLAASLRENFGDAVALVGYCPAHKIDLVHPEVKQVLAKLNCDLRPMLTEGRFDPPYPHGNKILATLEPRDTEFSCFMDSDILTLRPNQVDNLIKAGCVSLTPAASMGWAKQSVWPAIYAAVGLPLPEERIRLMKQKKGNGRMPYFSSGLFSFPEQYRTPEGKSFPEVWMEVAQTLDAAPDLPAKRPYLDQMSLPLAIQKAGLQWNLLPDAQHFILGGKARGEPLPTDREIYAVHYRQWPLIKELGLSAYAKALLVTHAGVKKVALEAEPETNREPNSEPNSEAESKALRRQRRTEKRLAQGSGLGAGQGEAPQDDKAAAKAARKARNLARAGKKTAVSPQARPETAD